MTTPDNATLKRLAETSPGSPVVSVHLRTDPRDPSNTHSLPAWLVKLRNGLREVQEQVEGSAEREHVMAMREAAQEIESRITHLSPAERGRSLSMFVSMDGALDELVTSQVPIRNSVVRWDRRPYITPLVEVVDKSRPIGIILVDADEVAVMQYASGHVIAPEGAFFDRQDWQQRGEDRPAPRLRTFNERFSARDDDHRRRFLQHAAEEITALATELEWPELLLAAAPGTLEDFRGALPQEVDERIVATTEALLTGLDTVAVAERLADAIETAWRNRTEATVDRALAQVASGGRGAQGAAEVLDALAEARVEHLVCSPDLEIDPGEVSPGARDALGDRPDHMWRERAFEKAAETDAEISILPDHEPLEKAGGIVAFLRW